MAQGLERIPLAIDSDFQYQPIRANFPDQATPGIKLVSFAPDEVQVSAPAAQSRTAGQVTADTAYGFAKGAGSLVNGLGWLAGSDTLQKAGQVAEDFWGEKQTDELQSQLDAVGKAKGVIETISALWDNPSAIGDYIATSLPMMIPGMGVGSVGGRGIVAFAGNSARSAALRGGATEAVAMQAGRIAAEKAAEKSAMRFAVGANMVGEGGVSGAVTGADVEQFMLSKGASPEQAKAEANKAALLAGAWTTAGAGIGAGMETRAMLGRLKDTGAKGFAKNVGKEALEEAIQNPGEDYAGYQAKVKVDPTQTFDPGKSATLGVITGGFMGTGFHAAGRVGDRLSGKRDEGTDGPIPANDIGAGPSDGGGTSGEFIPADPRSQFPPPGAGSTYDQRQPAHAMLPSPDPLSGDVLGSETLPPGQRLLNKPAFDGSATEQGGEFARPAVSSTPPTERQSATARGLLNHSPKASPELLQRLMRIDQGMANLLFSQWNKGETNAQARIAIEDQSAPSSASLPGVLNAQSTQAVQGAPALQDLSQAAPEAGAVPGELTVTQNAPAKEELDAAQDRARSKWDGFDRGQKSYYASDIGYGSAVFGQGKNQRTLAMMTWDELPDDAKRVMSMRQLATAQPPSTGGIPEFNQRSDGTVAVRGFGRNEYREAKKALGLKNVYTDEQGAAVFPAPAKGITPAAHLKAIKKSLGYTEPKEIRTATRTPKTASTLLQAIVNRGGINREIMQDVGADAAGRYMPGLFTKNGTSDLSALAGYLFDEDGFHQIHQESSIGPARELEELIGRALGGEKVLSTDAMERGMLAEENAKLKDKAQRLGIKTVARKLADIAADVKRAEEQSVLDEETRLEDEILPAYNKAVDALNAAIGENDAENFLEDLASRYQDETQLNYLRKATIDIQEKINEQAVRNAGKPQESVPSPAGQDHAAGGAARGAGASLQEVRPAASGADASPGFALELQSEQDLAKQERERKAAEAQRKAEVDRAAAAERQARIDAEVAGRQGVAADNFDLAPQVNDKAKQKKADQAEIDRQLAGQGGLLDAAEKVGVGKIAGKPVSEISDKMLNQIAKSSQPAAEKAKVEVERRAGVNEDEQPGSFLAKPEELDAVKIKAGYAHRSHSLSGKVEMERKWYVDAVQAFYDSLLPLAKNDAQKSKIEQLTRAFRDEYRDRRYRVLDIGSSTYSAAIAGPSNFNSKQSARRFSSLDKAEKEFNDWTSVQDDVARPVLLALRTEEEKAGDDKTAESARIKKLVRPVLEDLAMIGAIDTGEAPGMDRSAFVSGAQRKIANLSTNGETEALRRVFTQVAQWDASHDKPLFASKNSVWQFKPVDVVEASPVENASAPAQPPSFADDGLTESDRVPKTGPYTMAEHADLMQRLNKGEVGIAEYKAAFARMTESKDALTAEFAAMKKDDIMRVGRLPAHWKNDSKDRLVKFATSNLIDAFHLGDSLQYGMGPGAKEQVITDYINGATQETLTDYAAKRKAAVDARAEHRAGVVEGIKNPQTIIDFQSFINFQKSEGKTAKEARMLLEPEQRARLDELMATESRSKRVASQPKQDVHVAAQTTGAKLVENKHTKTGAQLYTIQAEDRVSPEDFAKWKATAKQLDGYYSQFRGNGAVPGWIFTDKANAEAFLKYIEGDATEVKASADAQQDDRSQSAVDRLTTMADRLDEQADESLGRGRVANTARRARFAASAEAAANASKAMAQTMRNIAQSISDGSAKFLDGVRQKVQVEMLNSLVSSAQWDYWHAKYPTYAEQQKHQGEKPVTEVADYAAFPVYTAYRSDLATLGRQMLELDGAKKLGQRLMAVADDVEDAYLAFAKENLHQVSNFKRSDGGMATFSSRDQAEEAIKRSGYKGKAIVLPFKRGQNIIIQSPSAARENGIWHGDDDKKITITNEFGAELVAKAKELKSQRLSIPVSFGYVAEKQARLKAIGIENAWEMRAALREFIGMKQAPKAPDRVKELERAMAGKRNTDGLDFFPTPASTVQSMIDAAEIKEGMSVLEPSAGMGHIAEMIRAEGVEPDVIELANDRKELLEAKGFNVVGRDFMDMNGRESFTYGDVFKAPDDKTGIMSGGGGMGSNRVTLRDANGDVIGHYDRDELEGIERRKVGYDRILMNPPFGDRRDAEHVRNAYKLLNPGGRIVAIMGEGVFFGQDKKAQEFREWLESVGGTSEKLEEGTFLDPSLPVNTGVNARLVVIDLPETGSGGAVFSRQSGIGSPSHRAAVEKVAQPLLEGLARTPGLVVVQNSNELPFDAPGDANGALWRGDIYLVADNITTTEDARSVVAHELIGHFGLRGFFGGKLDAVLNEIHKNNLRVQVAAMKWRNANTDLIAKWKAERGWTDADVKAHSIEEALSEMAERGEKLNGWKRLAAMVQKLLRAVGLNKWANALEAKSDAEALLALKKAEMFVKRGWTESTPIPDAAYPLFMTAWHGSQHDHDGFDSSKIGTGEGVQAFGWGHYFAGAKEVAEFYRNKLSDPAGTMGWYVEQNEEGNWVVYTADDAVVDAFDSRAKAEASLEKKTGRLYQVELAPEADEYLHWDKPLLEQSEKVYDALEESGMAALVKDNATGQDIYNEIALNLSDDKLAGSTEGDKAASKYLHSIGIRGIRYLNGSSRGVGDGDHNYVIFDDADVKITAKESRATPEDMQFAANVLGELSDQDEAFRWPVSKSTSLKAVFAEIYPDAKYFGEHTRTDERDETGADHRHVFINHLGKRFYVYTRDNGRVWLDVSQLANGDRGNQIYAAVANWAYNNKLKFQGDPVGVSQDAVIRRTSNMLSSAIRFGTTRHLDASPEQIKGDQESGVEPLKWGSNDVENVRELIHTFIGTLHNKFPGLKDLHYDFARQGFFDKQGKPVTQDRFAAGARTGFGRAARAGEGTLRRGVFLKSLISSENGQRPGILEVVLNGGRALIEGGLKKFLSKTTPAKAGVYASDEAIGEIRSVVDKFKAKFKGTAELDIRVVGSAAEIPARFRPSPYAEGVFHDDAGLIYLVANNIPNEARAFQILTHEAVGHFGLARMMGDRFKPILSRVMGAAKAKGKVGADTYQPGDADYATVEAVRLRYPEATDEEVAQEVLARMSETDPGRTLFGYVRAVVRQWLRDVARSFGVELDTTTAELNDLVALASAYMRRGDNLADERTPGGMVAASQKVGADKTAGGMESRFADEAKRQPGKSSRGILDTILRKAGGEMAAKITGPAYDKLTAYLGGKIPEGIKAGMVSDYGLDESYTDRRTVMQTETQKGARQTKTFVEGLMDLDRAQSRIAYQWLNNRGKEAERLMAQLPPESRKVLEEIKQQIAKLTVEAVRLGQIDAETAARNFMAYLHRSYAKYDLNTDDKTWKAERAKSIKILGDQYKGRGLKMEIDPDRIHSAKGWWQGEMKGKTVRVLKSESGKYAFVAAGTATPAQYAEYALEGVWEIRSSKAANKITLWRDFTAEERQMMGELDEAKYAVARTLFMMQRDIEVGRFHEWVADQYAKMPEEAEEDGLTMADASESMFRAFKPDEWVTVPPVKVPGTGVFKYGALAGMVVPGPVWNDIRQISASRHEPFGAAYASILRAWKLSKTALTPTTHVNNIMGNFVMADMHDVGARDVTQAVRLMLAAAKGDKEAKALWERFEDSGATQGMFTAHELKKEVLDPLLQALREEVGMADGESAILKVSAILSLAFHGQIGEAYAEAKAAIKQSVAGRGASTLMTKAQDYYQNEDAVFRFAAFLKGIEDGKTDIESGRLAREAFLDYHINAPWINVMRGTVIPFISFAYRAVPMLAETAARKPWKIAKYMLVAGGLNALAYAMLGAGADEDKERAYLPEEKAGKLWGIVPKLIRMPWNRESTYRDGRKSIDPVFLDVRRWIPVGDVVDYGQDKTALPMIPQPLIPGGPAVIAFEFLVNKSAFTGKDLTKETDTWIEKAAKVGSHFYKGFAPNLPIPHSGTWAGTKIDNAIKGKEDPLGRVYPLPEAVASGFGLKLERYPIDLLRNNAALDMRMNMRELDQERRRLGRDYSRNGIERIELDEGVATIAEKKRKLAEEFKAKEARSN